MKFSHSLQFNAVPEWSSKYIAYSHLKKIVYALQKEKLYDSNNGFDDQLNGDQLNDAENSPLLHSGNNANDIYINKFIKELNSQLEKIDNFYIDQEIYLLKNFTDLKNDTEEYDTLYLSNFIVQQEHRPSNGSSLGSNNVNEFNDVIHRNISSPDENLADREDNVNALKNSVSASMFDHFTTDSLSHTKRKVSLTNSMNNIIMDNNIVIENKITIKKRLISNFTQFNELLDFINLNLTGFNKICKKFDKSLETNIKLSYLNSLQFNSHCFQDSTIDEIKKIINEIVIIFAKFSNSIPQTNSLVIEIDELENNEYFLNSKRQLSAHLRDHIIWERNTVWKDMINLERKSNNVNNNLNIDYFDNLYSSFNINNKKSKNETHLNKISKSTGSSPVSASDYNFRIFIRFILFTMLFILLLLYSPFSENHLEKNCFSILIYTSILWATETIPLFVTSLLIPLLIVVLPVLSDPTDPTRVLTPIQSSQFILSTMWSSVIMLLLGGFTLAAALSKFNIAKIISTHILSSVGTNPKIILLTNMSLALFISIWVSNVAAPVICFSIIQPILRTLPNNSSYGKSLILGIALASNIGGMASPISSPQNIFSLSLMDPQPTWIEWFAIAIPICIISILMIWILLVITFPLDPHLKILQLHPIEEKFTVQQWAVCIITILTIFLWCFSSQISGIFGDMGIISIIPLVIFFGTGLLNSEDFNNFMWTIIILAMGGTTLGKAVSLSGLLSHVADLIKTRVENESLFTVVLIFGLLILVMATFVSHVVAAMIVLPLMNEIGSNLGSNHSRLLIMVATLLCSCAMGLPTSGIPNVTAISMTDELGSRYLTVNNFITRGFPASLLCYFVVVTVGFGLMKLIGF